jgi:hypothetical protein
MDLQYLAKIAPARTAGVAFGAFLVACISLWVQKGIARKRAAIDFFFKTEMDKEMLLAQERFKSAVVALEAEHLSKHLKARHTTKLCGHI